MGCDRGPRKVDEGVCEECLQHPKRGRKWAQQAHRCRTEPDFARKTYDSISTERGKKLFVALFGLPSGAMPPTPQLHTVDEEEPEPVARVLRLVR